MTGFGATEYSPYSQWWNATNPMEQGVQVNPVPDAQVEVRQLPTQEQAAGRNKLATAMLQSGMLKDKPLTSLALNYLNNGGQGLGLGNKIASGLSGLFGG